MIQKLDLRKIRGDIVREWIDKNAFPPNASNYLDKFMMSAMQDKINELIDKANGVTRDE